MVSGGAGVGVGREDVWPGCGDVRRLRAVGGHLVAAFKAGGRPALLAAERESRAVKGEFLDDSARGAVPAAPRS